MPKKATTSTRKKTTTKKSRAKEIVRPEFSIELRSHQIDAVNAFDAGKRKQMDIWHRRAGKDAFGMQLTRREIIRNPATYWHLFPKHSQARRAIWTGIDARQKRKFIDIAFGDLYTGKPNQTDMFIEMDNNATWQLLGSDNYDRHIGSNPFGVIFSEWALCDPKSWEYIRPIIKENGGWALFITTYRGRNHAYQMAQSLQDNPEWYVDIRTVRDTVRNDGTPIISDADIQAERDDGMSEALIQQEYFCNPIATLDGAIYGNAMEYLQTSGSIDKINYDPMRPVWAVWSFQHFPLSTSVILLQPNRNSGADLLWSDTRYFEDSTEFFSVFSRSAPYPVARHIFYGAEHAPDIIEQAEEFGFCVDTVEEYEDQTLKAKTALWLRKSNINVSQNILLDSLRGYRMRDADVYEEYRGYDSSSFEQYLVACCEAAAMYQEHTEWNRSPWHSGRTYKSANRMNV